MIDQKLDKTNDENSLVTFAIIAYNQENYIREAVEGALAQTYEPLEIIISDDCSTDGTFERIKEAIKSYPGPHKIKLNRNQKNIGLVEHVNKIFEISSGDFIVAAAGDDISLPHRTHCLMEAFRSGGQKAMVIHSSAIKINEFNEEVGVFVPPASGQRMSIAEMAVNNVIYIGATGGWHRSLYAEFGPITFRNAYEDLVLGFRAAVKGSLVYVNKPLVRYRENVGITSRKTFPLFHFSARIDARMKNLRVLLDVYNQRLCDLARLEDGDEYIEVRARLRCSICFQNKRILFYCNPLMLFSQIVSRDCIHVLRAFNSEIKHLIGLND